MSTKRLLAFSACVLLTLSLVVGPRSQLTSIPQLDSSCAETQRPATDCGRLWGLAVDTGTRSLVDAVTATETRDGRHLDLVHTYHRWADNFPTKSEALLSQNHTLLINWHPTAADGTPIKWAAIASGAEDGQIDKTAARLRAFGKQVLLSFSHEPEDDLDTNGTVAQYAAAFRHVHDRLQSKGVTNVKYVWTVMGLDQPVWLARYPALWPGSAYVDWIAWDPYNWAGCRDRKWQSFTQIVKPFYGWLMAHGLGTKPFMLAEYGTVEDPLRPGAKAGWFTDIPSELAAFPNLRALVYFDLPAPPANCDWRADTSVVSEAGFKTLSASSRFAN